MSTDLTLFSIHKAVTTTLTADNPSASVALPGINSHQGGNSVMITNTGTTTVYVRSGLSDVTATATTGVPIVGGEKGTYRIDPSDTHIAGFASTPQAIIISQSSGV